jgi:serine/threonine protein kinase
MELIKGPNGAALDLSTWARGRVLASDFSAETTRQRISIARGVAEGMAFLHDKGYIHADLKPPNVGLAGTPLRTCTRGHQHPP